MDKSRSLSERLEFIRTDLRSLEAEFAGLESRDANEQRMANRMKSDLKARIIELFRDADIALRETQALKESVKEAAELWKVLDKSVVSSEEAIPLSGSRANPRVDHLGASTFLEKGWSRLVLGDLAAAKAALERALELAPDSSEGEVLLSWVYMLEERFDIALFLVHRVLSRDPRHALARVNHGYISLHKGQTAEAVRELTEVVQTDGDRRATLYACLYLGMAYRALDQVEHAEQCFRAALSRGPNLLQSWYELGQLYWSKGRQQDALAAWQSGAEANRFNPWGKRCSDQLKAVSGEEVSKAGEEAHALK